MKKKITKKAGLMKKVKDKIASQPDCSRHKKALFGKRNMKVVAESIGDLHYETLVKLLEQLSSKLEWDAKNDFIWNRRAISSKVLTASHLIRSAAIFIEDAWKISKPFMK